MKINYQMTDKQFKYILVSFYLVVFFIGINNPITFFNDSDGYLDMHIYRSAGYPIFLWLLKNIFGSQIDFATIIMQISIGIGSMYLFITRLKRVLKLHVVWYLLLAVVIAGPYIYSFKLANNYLSEALTYPLYLLVTLYFIESILTNSIKKLVISLPILAVLIITRSQFLFMVPIGLLIVFWLYTKQKKIKNYLWLGMAFLVLPLFTSLVDKTYHQIRHGYFISTPWVGIHLMSPAFYVADEKDYLLYDTEIEQEFFKSIYSQLHDKNLNIHNLNSEGTFDPTVYYIIHFHEIANGTIYESGKELLGNNMTEYQKLIALDTLTKKMALPLVMDNFNLWLKLYFKNSISAFGNIKYASIYLIILIFGFIGILKKGIGEYKIITLLALLTLGNVALIAVGMHTIKRFTFYNDWVLFFVIFILMNAYLSQKKHMYEH